MKTATWESLAPRTPAEAGFPVVPEPAGPTAERRTREAVVRLLLADGPLTAAALAERLRLSAAGVRRHLDQLDAEGAVTSREAHAAGPRGRGRPARAYQLSEIGRSRLPHAYDQLAIEALEFLADHVGPAAVAGFARQRAESIVAGVQDELAAATDVSAKAEVLATALTDHGFSASVRQVGIGEQLCQHHCPVAHVAARFPQLCEEEFAVIAEALGTYAQRLATIARGDSFCTTFIPRTPRPTAAASVSPSAPLGRTTS